jgi:hypothetical protein
MYKNHADRRDAFEKIKAVISAGSIRRSRTGCVTHCSFHDYVSFPAESHKRINLCTLLYHRSYAKASKSCESLDGRIVFRYNEQQKTERSV